MRDLARSSVLGLDELDVKLRTRLAPLSANMHEISKPIPICLIRWFHMWRRDVPREAPVTRASFPWSSVERGILVLIIERTWVSACRLSMKLSIAMIRRVGILS
jgi:hypothetical protein